MTLLALRTVRRGLRALGPPRRGLTTAPAAFTRADLDAIAGRLLPHPTTAIADLPPHKTGLFNAARKPAYPRDAAVLIPLCNVGGKAHILLEVRSAGLRVHASEAR